MNSLIGRKTKQTQAFLTDGTRIPVTVVEVSDNAVLAIKTIEKDGYTAVQIGFGKRKHSTKPLLGHVKKANLDSVPQVIREVRVRADEALPAIGDMLAVENVFKPGDIIKVTGKSKGKGFAGVVKRHNFRGGPRTHGQSDRERAPGSIGQTTTPGRVYKGKRMAGRMGQDTVSVTSLQVVDVVTTGNVKTLLVKGLVPGSLNSILFIEKTGELSAKKFVAIVKPANTESPEDVTHTGTQKAAEEPANTENTEKHSSSESTETSVSSVIAGEGK